MASNTPGISDEKLRKEEEDKSIITKFSEGLIKPITKQNILYHYLPLHGALCYSAMSVNVMNPALFSEFYPKKDITNFLLFGSVGGVALYAFNKPHLRNLHTKQRIIYSSFGAIMFTFGSILIWAVMRSVIPENAVVGSAVGVLTAGTLLKCGTSYCHVIDSHVPSHQSR